MLAETWWMPAVFRLSVSLNYVVSLYFKQPNSATELFCAARLLVLTPELVMLKSDMLLCSSAYIKGYFQKGKQHVEDHKIQRFSPFRVIL